MTTATRLGSRLRQGALAGEATGPVLLLVVGVAVWWLVSTQTFVVPSPPAALAALGELLGEDEFRRHLLSTAFKTAWAIAISVVVGTLAGVVLGVSPRLRTALEPLVIAGNAVPKIILYPLLVLVLSLGNRSQIALGALFAFFPVMINVAAGVRGIPPVYLRLARRTAPSPRQVVLSVMLPAIRRPFLTGVRLAVSLSSVGVVLAEIFATQLGLGRVIMQAYGFGSYDRMVAAILVLVAGSCVASVSLWRTERRMR